MAIPEARGLFRAILGGYLRALRRVGVLLALILAAGLAGLAVTWPLWALATRHRPVYNLLIAVVLGGLLLAFLALRLRRSIRESGGFGALLRRRWLPFLGRLLAGLLLVVLLYVALLLLAGGQLLPGLILGLLFLLAFGYAIRTSRG